MTAHGIQYADPSYSEAASKLTADVNRAAGGNAGRAKADEQLARRRRDFARRFLDEARSRAAQS